MHLSTRLIQIPAEGVSADPSLDLEERLSASPYRSEEFSLLHTTNCRYFLLKSVIVVRRYEDNIAITHQSRFRSGVQ